MIGVIIIYYERIPSQAKHLILQYSTVPHTHFEFSSMGKSGTGFVLTGLGCSQRDMIDSSTVYNSSVHYFRVYNAINLSSVDVVWSWDKQLAPRSCNMSSIFRASDLVPFSRALLI